MTAICFVCNLPILSHQVGLVWQGGNGWDDLVREQVEESTLKQRLGAYATFSFNFKGEFVAANIVKFVIIHHFGEMPKIILAKASTISARPSGMSRCATRETIQLARAFGPDSLSKLGASSFALLANPSKSLSA